MGNPNGFMEYTRQDNPASTVEERIKNYNEFHTPISEADRKRQGERCMHCGVPFCQAGLPINGMVSGCPLNNLIPEWNNLVSLGAWKQAYHRLKMTNSFPEFTSRASVLPCAKRRVPAVQTAILSRFAPTSLTSLKRHIKRAGLLRNRRNSGQGKRSRSSVRVPRDFPPPISSTAAVILSRCMSEAIVSADC